MEFCPTCGNMLLYESADTGRPARFFCPTCPYVCYMESKVKIKKKQRLVKKDLEPVITDDDMKNASHTDATCPRCGHGRAAYVQFQTRSADEPATTFYTCLNESCRQKWRED